MRASVAVSSFDHSTPFKRPHSTISNSSSSSSSSQSSSSLLSSLNLHLHPSLSHWPYDCIEEDELEHDSTVQSSTMSVQHHPVLVMESYTCDGGSSLSPSPPEVSSSILYHAEQELQSQSSTFITAL
ncbi:pleckstrin homology domain-containing family G member 4B-like [Sinocyclocheilus grahami]|uniref:pleckstrin homology domain-containing family G member 4B-like n=1 Tax=Sinocyclocheilus grahami TaxID=75366 RepID=UPI0007AD4EA7|nr:PREDICTED: pleckstrin homology domain-containing family G member 4B-like [Sinocyclocheilus grahami]